MSKNPTANLMIILNDQGGAVMHWSCNGISNTLRAQDHGHPPVVVIKNEEDEQPDPDH